MDKSGLLRRYFYFYKCLSRLDIVTLTNTFHPSTNLILKLSFRLLSFVLFRSTPQSSPTVNIYFDSKKKYEINVAFNSSLRLYFGRLDVKLGYDIYELNGHLDIVSELRSMLIKDTLSVDEYRLR
jgi:hypothetical protein